MLILTPAAFSTQTATPTSEVDWARSPNGQQLADHGSCALALLPPDDEVVLVLPPTALSWHQVNLPKVAANRLRAALDGLLEDRLLSDPAELHFAMEPGARAGQTLWVAACHKAWLRGWLQALEGAGRPVTRIVPTHSPLRASDTASAVCWAYAQQDQAWLVGSTAAGVFQLPLPEHGSLNVPWATEDAQWLTEPAVAAQAERALDRRLQLQALPTWLLRCAQGEWNLAQFDLSLSGGARRQQRLRQTLRHLATAPAWRPARWGLIALLASLLVGLNALAWMERRELAAKQKAITQTLQQTFPEVGLVLDAPAQMQRQLITLQQSRGTLSGQDLEAMLSALASINPDASPSAIDFSPGQARLSTWNLPEDQLQALSQTLNARDWQSSIEAGALIVRPKAP